VPYFGQAAAAFGQGVTSGLDVDPYWRSRGGQKRDRPGGQAEGVDEAAQEHGQSLRVVGRGYPWTAALNICSVHSPALPAMSHDAQKAYAENHSKL
jgi:hypothetical protein